MSLKPWFIILALFPAFYLSAAVYDTAGNSATAYQNDIKILKKILAVKKSDQRSLERIIKLSFAAENFEDAVSYCDQYLPLNRSAEFRYIKAISLANLSRYKEASAVMKELSGDSSLDDKERRDFSAKYRILAKNLETRGEPSDGRKTLWGSSSYAVGLNGREYSLLGVNTSPDGKSSRVFRYSFRDSAKKDNWKEPLLDGIAPSALIFFSVSPNGREVYATVTGPEGKLELKYRVYNPSVKEWSAWKSPSFAGRGDNNSFANPLGDNEHLLFVSNRDNAAGLDIYSVRKKNSSEWSDPVKVKGVNTPFDECSLFVHPDGETVYFSSNGRPGCGGYDLYTGKLFYSKGEMNIGNIVCLSGINTFRNESLPVFPSVKGDRAFFTHTKSGIDSIYETALNGFSPFPVMYFSCGVFDAQTKKPLAASVSMVRTGEGKSGISLSDLTDETGVSLFAVRRNSRYTLAVAAEGYVYYSEALDLDDNADAMEKTIYLEKGKIKAGFTFVAENMFFNTDSSVPLEESQPALERLYQFMKKYPGVKIEISGHTDNTGSHKHNIDLSLKRADTIAEYLFSKGIKKSRVTTKGYGHVQNASANDTEAGRQKNRRVEIKVLSSE